MSEATLVGNEKIALQDIVKRLKRELEGWREILLQIYSVLLWEQSWYPGVIIGASTVIFTLLWTLDPSLLSTMSSFALLITLLDYLVPTISASIYSSTHWTAAHERQFERICRILAQGYTITGHQIIAFKDLKMSSPKLYYSVVITSLATLAYIGNKVNNLLLTYILVTSLLLVPGLSQHGILQKYYQLILHAILNLLKGLQGGDKVKVN